MPQCPDGITEDTGSLNYARIDGMGSRPLPPPSGSPVHHGAQLIAVISPYASKRVR